MTITDKRVTTIDNPFSPFEQYDEWKKFDEDKGYNTINFMCRVMQTSPDMTDVELAFEYEKAAEQICKLNPLGLYKLVSKEIEID